MYSFQTWNEHHLPVPNHCHLSILPMMRLQKDCSWFYQTVSMPNMNSVFEDAIPVCLIICSVHPSLKFTEILRWQESCCDSGTKMLLSASVIKMLENLVQHNVLTWWRFISNDHLTCNNWNHFCTVTMLQSMHKCYSQLQKVWCFENDAMFKLPYLILESILQLFRLVQLSLWSGWN